MKIEKHTTEFQPFTFTITIETQEEYDAIKEMSDHPTTISDLVGDEYCTEVSEFLCLLWRTLVK